MSCDHRQGPRTAGLCDPCSPGLRNLYYRGKPITVSDYQAEQAYGIGRRRLVNRAMLGWGLVSGFRLRLEDGALLIGDGFALDRCGHELVACDPVALNDISDLIWIRAGACGYEPTDPPGRPDGAEDAGQAQPDRLFPIPGTYVLRAHYAELEVDGISLDDGCGGATCAFNHLCETVVYSLAEERCRPGLADCRHCDPEAVGAGPAEEALPLARADDRGPQARLCCWSQDWVEDPGICDRCRLTRHGCVQADLDHGLPLACLRIALDDCGNLRVLEIEASCPVRRLARPNDQLFDLIRGCDLTRIIDIGWRDWDELGADREVRFKSFRTMFDPPPDNPEAPDDSPPEPSSSRFWVETSGPVRVDSLTPAIFTITVLNPDDDEGYQSIARVRVEAVGHEAAEQDPPGTARRFWPLVSGYFYNGEIASRQASKFRERATVEIWVDGNRIVDAAGQCLAAGRRANAFPSGFGQPGGIFTSRFGVSPSGEDIPPHPDQVAEPAALPPPPVEGEAQ